MKKSGSVLYACNTSMGASLEQQINGCHWEPLSFFSEKFDSAKRNYSKYDRKLTAVYESMKYFNFWLEALDFEIYSDHKPL